MKDDIIKDYKRRAECAREEVNKFLGLINNFSWLRLALLILFIAAISFAIKFDEILIVIISIIILIPCFGLLVARQSKFESLKNYFTQLEMVNENEIRNIESHANIYSDGKRFINDIHYYTSDLDIFGTESLFQLINRCASTMGCEKLAGWLSSPQKNETILCRQEAIKEIASMNNWKLDIQARLLFSNKKGHDLSRQLFKYLETPLNLSGELWLKKYIKIAPFLMLSAITIACFYPALTPFVILIGLINLGIVNSKSQYIKKADLISGEIGSILAKYSVVFNKIEDQQWKSAYCFQMVKCIKEFQTSIKIKELSSLIDKLNYRLNFVVGNFLNLFFLWEIRQIILIDCWRKNNNKNFEIAFDFVAEYESLISLAGLHINNPCWCFPEITEGQGYTLSAVDIGHPLIKEDHRITNNYELNDIFKIDIITGSNMAGKSTFLRTIGINTVLALCGAPVCAGKMCVSVITILTYMRIKDSLKEGTSTFKAEMERLQMLLNAIESGQKVFFLIDEILRGTNSVDKYLGSKAVITRLINKKAVGMVATHDLQIAGMEKIYPDYIRNFYFDIQVKNGEMIFDYKLKNGECKTFNATLLLKQIGIEIDV